MKLAKIFASMLLVLGLVYFLTQNAGENSKVFVDLIFKQYENAPVSMIILGALTIGILIGYLSAVFSVLSGKSEIRSLQNKNRSLTEELNISEMLPSMRVFMILRVENINLGYHTPLFSSGTDSDCRTYNILFFV
ncbi:MAG: LapA family protein [Candidatus Marinimicrobia bacterium]|nr:LapA family protein [Candidatus Neomarinimicrobiota bacterium]